VLQGPCQGTPLLGVLGAIAASTVATVIISFLMATLGVRALSANSIQPASVSLIRPASVGNAVSAAEYQQQLLDARSSDDIQPGSPSGWHRERAASDAGLGSRTRLPRTRHRPFGLIRNLGC
jgi:hypothetical protein